MAQGLPCSGDPKEPLSYWVWFLALESGTFLDCFVSGIVPYKGVWNQQQHKILGVRSPALVFEGFAGERVVVV